MSKTTSTSVIKYAKNARRAFVFFSNEHKPTIRKATGLGKGRDGRKALDSRVADAWKHLPKEHRAKYQEMERQDKARFQQEVASGLPVQKSGNAKAPKKSSTAPKKPHSPFLLFSNATRKAVVAEAAAAGEELTVGQIAKRLGAAWKALSQEQRQPYIDQGREASEQYLRETQAYLGQQLEQQLDLQRQHDQKAAKSDSDRPKMFLSAYIRFMSANRERVKASSKVPLNAKDLSRALGAEWKALSEEEKRPFEEEAAVDGARYREEMQAYRLRKHDAQLESSAKLPKVAGAPKAAPKVKKHAKAVVA